MKNEKEDKQKNTSDDGLAELSVCEKCRSEIYDRYYLVVNSKHWHVGCLICYDCRLPLDAQLTCFIKDERVYCREGYHRIFSPKRCPRCLQEISAQELVMHARGFVYHVDCFACVACSKPLKSGEQFGMTDTLIYCKTDYELLLAGEFFELNPPCDERNDVSLDDVNFFEAVTEGKQKGRTKKKKNSSREPHITEQFSANNMLDKVDMAEIACQLNYAGECVLSSTRQKRIRTSFKHHQLRTMKNYFTLNHNPDAKDLKELSQKTGLSKRVLQVWFQNARAKYRRNLVKKDGEKTSEMEVLEDQGSETNSRQLECRSNTQSPLPSSSDISSTGSESLRCATLVTGSIKLTQDNADSTTPLTGYLSSSMNGTAADSI